MPMPPKAVVVASPVARSTSTLHGSPRDPLPDLASASPRPTASSTSSRGSGRAPGFNDFTDSIRPPVCRTKDTAAGAISCTTTAMCASADAPTPAAARIRTASGVNSDAHTWAIASATAAQLSAWTPTTLTCPPHPLICAGSSTLADARTARSPVPSRDLKKPAHIVAASSSEHPASVMTSRTPSQARSMSGGDPARVAASTAAIAFWYAGHRPHSRSLDSIAPNGTTTPSRAVKPLPGRAAMQVRSPHVAALRPARSATASASRTHSTPSEMSRGLSVADGGAFGPLTPPRYLASSRSCADARPRSTPPSFTVSCTQSPINSRAALAAFSAPFADGVAVRGTPSCLARTARCEVGFSARAAMIPVTCRPAHVTSSLPSTFQTNAMTEPSASVPHAPGSSLSHSTRRPTPLPRTIDFLEPSPRPAATEAALRMGSTSLDSWKGSPPRMAVSAKASLT
mmetsp:Transcript_1354/g.5529  ORF Transcript_1354/g.5529 Transcript_1354/m.5529 type:complete len:457 (-) Transcript_1354:3329-4699(-)